MSDRVDKNSVEILANTLSTTIVAVTNGYSVTILKKGSWETDEVYTPPHELVLTESSAKRLRDALLRWYPVGESDEEKLASVVIAANHDDSHPGLR